jgi:hypothetical protein
MNTEPYFYVVVDMDRNENWCEGEGWKPDDGTQVVTMYATEKRAQQVAWTLCMSATGRTRLGIACVQGE